MKTCAGASWTSNWGDHKGLPRLCIDLLSTVSGLSAELVSIPMGWSGMKLDAGDLDAGDLVVEVTYPHFAGFLKLPSWSQHLAASNSE